MTVLDPKDPAHWHSTDGDGVVRHRMTDPRRHFDGDVVESHLDPDEKAYLAHLRRHEDLERSPEPRDDDPELLRDVLLYVASERRKVDKLAEMVELIRRELAAGVPLKDSKGVAALAAVWPPPSRGSEDTEPPYSPFDRHDPRTTTISEADADRLTGTDPQ